MLRGLLVVALGTVFICGSAHADRIAVFGPHQFDKPKGKPVHYVEQVAPTGYPGRYFMQVENGVDDELEAKNVSVLLAGVEVADSGALRLSNPCVASIDMDGEVPIEVILKGQGGNHITVEIFQERDAQIVVDQPLEGANVTSQVLRVAGRVTTFGAADFGVRVNGRPAVVDGETFVTDLVVLLPGWNTITVESFTATEMLAETSLQVFYEEGHQFAWLEADEPVYIAPAVVRMELEKFLPSPTLSENLVCDGPESVDIYQGERGYEGNFEVPGVYSCRGQIEDATSGMLEATTSFRVMGLEELKETAAKRWGSMQASLREGDLEGALMNISERSRDRYRSVFTVLADRMAGIAMNMKELEYYKLYGNRALFKVRKPEVHGGVEYEITHEVHFKLDSDGIWRLVQL